MWPSLSLVHMHLGASLDQFYVQQMPTHYKPFGGLVCTWFPWDSKWVHHVWFESGFLFDFGSVRDHEIGLGIFCGVTRGNMKGHVGTGLELYQIAN